VRIIHRVPRLWNDTIEAHRREVREAILDSAATLVADRGLRAVTMSEIAEATGIGRGTLYKYFPDVDAVLFAWHDRQIRTHLDYLAEVAEQRGDAAERLEAVLEAFALVVHESHGHNAEVAALLHRDGQVADAEQQLRHLVRELLAEGAQSGALRSDISPDELASYSLHALGAASGLPSKAAVRRLVALTLAGLRPQS
jgi:AcrR family transcriptional regulator